MVEGVQARPTAVGHGWGRCGSGQATGKYMVSNRPNTCGMCVAAHPQEILLAIKLVKFYVWESSFSKQVSDVSV